MSQNPQPRSGASALSASEAYALLRQNPSNAQALRTLSASLRREPKTTLAIPVVGDHQWHGGVVYVQLLATAIRSLPRERQPGLVFLLRQGEEGSLDLYRPFLHLFDQVFLVGFHPGQELDTAGTPTLRFASFPEAASRFDVMYPLRPDILPGVPGAAWIPDFQHRHLPRFFSDAELRRRDNEHSQIAAKSPFCVFSSLDAESDFRAFYPQSACQSHVLRFYHQLPDDAFQNPVEPVVAKYGLGRKFLLCCNQFWIHKGHDTLFRAFAKVAREFPDVDLVCTGNTEDYRAAGYFATLVSYLKESGLESRVKILGLIPREDQLQLLRAAMGVVHASLFEGWSTVVEDCRSLGKRMLLTDLAVHVEQDPPNALYFQRGDEVDLATKLRKVIPTWKPGPDLAEESCAREESVRNLEQFGNDLLSLCEKVLHPENGEDGAVRCLEEATKAFARNDPSVVESILDSEIILESTDAKIQRAAGNLLLRANRLNAARAKFLFASRLAPNDPDVHLDLGVAWMLLGRAQEADAALFRALEIAPQRGDIWKAMGQLRLRAKDQEGGIKAYRKALDLLPDDPECLVLVGGWHARRGDLPQARALLEKAARLRPDDAGIAQELSRLGTPVPAVAPVSGGGVSTGVLFCANFVPTADSEWSLRQQRCARTLSDLASRRGIGLVNLRYPDEQSTLPQAWRDAPVLKRSGRDVVPGDQKRKPFVTDLFDVACTAAEHARVPNFAVLNSDVVATPALLDRIAQLLAQGIESIAVSRTECTYDGEIPRTGRMEYLGFDLFVVGVATWKRERRRFRDYVFGERAWDDAWASILLSHSRGMILWEPGLLLHPSHETKWISGAYSDHNMDFYQGTDVEYALRFRRLQKEAEAQGLTDHQRFDPSALIESIFRRPLSGRPIVSVVVVGTGDAGKLWRTLESILTTTWEPYLLSAVDSGPASRQLMENLRRDGFLRTFESLPENGPTGQLEERILRLRGQARRSVVVEAGFQATDGTWLRAADGSKPAPLSDTHPTVLACEARARERAAANDLAGFSDACGEMVVLAGGNPSVLHRLEPILAGIRRPPAGRESALAHRILDGSHGLEIGGSAHNPFGLATRNVGMVHRGYIAEQIRLCGTCMPIDIETDAATLPVADESEDFVVSSHVLEHTTDVARTLLDWFRVVRPGGYIHIITPLPGASSADDDKQPITWKHVFEDLVQDASPAMEPEQDSPGNNHYHLLTLGGMEEVCAKLFGNRCEVVARQEVDDKVGNGCTLVLRKVVPLDRSFPWRVESEGDSVDLVRLKQDVESSLLDTEGSTKTRHAVAQAPFTPDQRAHRLSTWNGGWSDQAARGPGIPIALGADPRMDVSHPAWFRQGSRAAMEGMESLGIDWIDAPSGSGSFGELADLAALRACENDNSWFGVLLSPALPTPRFLALARQKMTDDRDILLVGTDEIQELDFRGTPIAGHVSPDRFGLVLCRGNWWADHRAAFVGAIHGADLFCTLVRAGRALPVLRGGFLVGLPQSTARESSHDPLWQEWLAGNWVMGVPYKDEGEGILQKLAMEFPETRANTSKLVNIGMITYNRLEFTRQTLDSFHQHTKFPHELTIVDNASTDGSREYLLEQKRLGRITNLVLLEENVGVAKASNLAWSLVPQATHYLKLDNDIVLRKDGWLDEMVRMVDSLPEVGVVAYSFEPISFPVVEVRGMRIRPKNSNLGGACILIPNRTRDILGVWSEDYGLYGEEDLDYGFRVQASGLVNAYMEDEDMGFHLPAGKAAVIDTGTWLAADGKEEVIHAQYRLMKDQNRAKNHQSGIVDANFKAYLDGTKSKKVESVFAREYLERQVQTEKPLSLLVCTMNPPSNCCAHLRVLQHLRQDPSIRTNWTAESRPSPAFIHALGAADIVLVQRGYVANRKAMEAIRESGKPWVLEMDDLLWEDLPPSNPHAREFRESAGLLIAALRDCDAAIASTPELGEAMERYAEDVHVVPNLLDPQLWLDAKGSVDAEPVVIAYAGTATHFADLALVESALERISKVHGNKVSFLFLGCATPRLQALPNARVIGFSDDYAAYAKSLLGAGIHIALAPLEDHPFNRAKSAIKWLEYSACRAAGIYSDLLPYQETVRDGENGFLAVNNPDVWFDRIDRLVRDPGLRQRIADTAHGEVRSRYMLDPKSSPLARALRTIHAERSVPRQTSLSTRKPDVSIVIPVHGHLELTQQCLQALRATIDPITTEIVVVDDASPDSTAAWLGEQEKANVLKAVHFAANRGFATACNAGAAVARGSTLVFLNNDTIPQAGWLEPLVRSVQGPDGAGMSGARLLYPDRTIQHAGIHFHPGGMPFHVHRGAPADHPDVLRPATLPAVTGACIAMPSDLFRSLGGFDESFHMYVEDIDLCLKTWDAGREVRYVPQSVVIHLESASTSDLERRDEQVRTGLTKLHARWAGRWPQALRGIAGMPDSYFPTPAPTSRARVQWISPVWDPSGYADESRAFLKHLATTDLGVAAKPWGRHSETFRQSASARDRDVLDAALGREPVPGSPVVLDIPAHALGRVPGAGHHVGRTTFETDGLPPDWVERCNSMDEIWVPCAFNKDTFAKAGVTVPILVVPEGVDVDKFRPGLEPLTLPGSVRGTTFLAVFEWTHRKGPDLLLQAWAKAFGPDDDVRLVLRTYPPNQIEGDPTAWVESKIEEELARHGRTRADCAPIAVIAKQIPDTEMPRLYAAANVFVAPSRGEGWGRPHMEAMACGVPVIATRWSGNLEFQDDNNSWLIEIDGLEEIDAREEFPFYRGQKWAKPSVNHLANLLRTTLDPALRRAKGVRARQDMENRWDWSKIAPIAEARLREILSGVPADASTLAHTEDSAPLVTSDPVAPIIENSTASVRWCGQMFNFSGYARLAREAVAGLMDAGVSVTADPLLNDKDWFSGISSADRSRWSDLLSRSPEPGLLVCCDIPRDAKGANELFDQMNAANPGCTKRVGWTMFETDRLPDGWVQSLNRLDEVWVPSEFNRRTFSESGVRPDKIHVIPGSVDPEPYRSMEPYPLTGPSRGTTFLSVFQWVRRKGWDVLLRAWAQAFDPKADVRLILRCHPFGAPASRMRDIFRQSLDELGLRQADLAPIVLLDEFIPQSRMPSLFAASDVFVLPSRGEGWGLPYMEAMASGKPSIATDWGASTDFLHEGIAWLASPRELVPVGDAACVENPYLSSDHRWADPDPSEVAGLLRRAASNVPERLTMGRQARQEALALWTPCRTANSITRRMQAMGFGKTAVAHHPSRALVAVCGGPLSTALEKVAAGLRTTRAMRVPATIAANPVLSVRWEGSQFVHHSLAHVNREICLRLAKRGHDLSLIPWEPDQFEAGTDADLSILASLRNAPLEAPCQVHVRHQWPPDLHPPAEGKWVVIQPWEFGSPPVDWVAPFRDQVDEVWAYTEYVKRVYVEAGIPESQVRVVPLGVDTDRFRPGLEPLPDLPRDGRLTFLYVGGTIARKGFDILLDAWRQAFRPTDPVRLVVKDMGGVSFYKGQTGEAMVHELNASGTCASVVYIDRDLSLAELPRLYASGDVLVHPFRGEGFGLPIAEAMASGLPAVLTRGGASDDFCGDAESWGIPAKRVDVPGGKVGPFATVTAPWWLEPSVVVLVRTLREVASDKAGRREKGEAARKRILSGWTWDHTAVAVESALREIASRPGTRRSLPASNLDIPSDHVAPSEETLKQLNKILFRAEAAAARGELGAAESATQDAIETFPDQPLVWLARAMVLRGLGKFAKASEAVEKSLHLVESPEALLESAMIHRMAGQTARAKGPEKILKERHAQWLAATRNLYQSRGRVWPLNPPRKSAKKSAAPPLKGRK